MARLGALNILFKDAGAIAETPHGYSQRRKSAILPSSAYMTPVAIQSARNHDPRTPWRLDPLLGEAMLE